MKPLVLFALTLPVFGQLQVLTLQGNSAVPAGSSVNLGTAASGDSTEYRFRVLNTAAAPIALQTVAVNGAGFSLAAPFLASTLAPAQFFDFSVRFSPSAEGSYSAVLTVNSFTTLLRAAAVPGPSLFLTFASQISELTSSSLQVNIASGQTLTLALSIGNPHSSPLLVSEISISGRGFSLVGPPSVPLTLAPGESVPIPVAVVAGEIGENSGTLTIGARRFSIVAIVFRPQLAPPNILTGTVAPRNGQQLKIRLQLPQPATGSGSGVLRATFIGAADDPAIVFPNGLREINFDVAGGSRDATFEGAAETVIQTGTTAGILRLDAITETGTVTETYRFDRSPVVVDEAVARRSGSSLEIDITGFDNVRDLGSMNFRFFDRSGTPMGGVITTTPGDQFKTFFAQSTLGGIFRLRASFPVTGDATIVGSVLIEVANSVGRTDLQRLNFP